MRARAKIAWARHLFLRAIVGHRPISGGSILFQDKHRTIETFERAALGIGLRPFAGGRFSTPNGHGETGLSVEARRTKDPEASPSGPEVDAQGAEAIFPGGQQQQLRNRTSAGHMPAPARSSMN